MAARESKDLGVFSLRLITLVQFSVLELKSIVH